MNNFLYIKSIQYSSVNENGTQYDKRRFDKYEIVDAVYTESNLYPGNPLVCALPPAVSEEELSAAATTVMDFNHKEIIEMSDHRQLEIIGQIKKAKKMNIYLPMYYDFSINVRECLLSSYGNRVFNLTDPHLIEVCDPNEVFPRVRKDDDGTDGGFNMYGASGSGKSTVRGPVMSFYPQGIRHPLTNGGHFIQITYIQVECPDSNISELYERIGMEIDAVLQRSHMNSYRNMLKGTSKTTNSKRATILSELINAFGIGLIILDEAQNLKLNDKAIIELLNVSNTTEVNFAFISTKFLFPEYEMTEDNRKILRRFGNEIVADEYCQNTDCFYAIIQEISKYQLFDPEIHMIQILYDKDGYPYYVPVNKDVDVLNAIYNFSQGRIEAIVKLWIEMNKIYVENGRTDSIDEKFVQRVIESKLYHQSLIPMNETKVMQTKLHNVLSNKNSSSIAKSTEDYNREADTYIDMAREACSDLQVLALNYDEKVINEAVLQAVQKLSSKNKGFTKDDIKREAIKLITGASKKKKPVPSDPVSKDEFIQSRLKASNSQEINNKNNRQG